MKKYITILILSFFAILSCEKDDICIDTTTPFLVIRFSDFDNPETKKQVSGLTVWANGKDSIYSGVSTDSITVPLDLNNNFTLYKLSSNSLVDDVNFVYSRNDIFVGRSCGYKTNYEDLQDESFTTNWIKEIEILNSTIDNDTIAAVTIFH